MLDYDRSVFSHCVSDFDSVHVGDLHGRVQGKARGCAGCLSGFDRPPARLVLDDSDPSTEPCRADGREYSGAASTDRTDVNLIDNGDRARWFLNRTHKVIFLRGAIESRYPAYSAYHVRDQVSTYCKLFGMVQPPRYPGLLNGSGSWYNGSTRCEEVML